VFTGIPFTVEILSGADSRISINLEELNVSRSYNARAVRETFTVPLTFLPGTLTLSGRITPENPSYKGASFKFKVTVVNLPAAALAAFAVTLLPLTIFRGRRPSVEREVGHVVQPKVLEAASPLPPTQSAFLELVRLLERVSSIAMKPSHTLREYLSRLSSTLKAAVEGVFQLYERFLYGRPEGGLESKVVSALGEALKALRRMLEP